MGQRKRKDILLFFLKESIKMRKYLSMKKKQEGVVTAMCHFMWLRMVS